MFGFYLCVVYYIYIYTVDIYYDCQRQELTESAEVGDAFKAFLREFVKDMDK